MTANHSSRGPLVSEPDVVWALTLPDIAIAMGVRVPRWEPERRYPVRTMFDPEQFSKWYDHVRLVLGGSEADAAAKVVQIMYERWLWGANPAHGGENFSPGSHGASGPCTDTGAT
jgi:hypothetical protein